MWHSYALLSHGVSSKHLDIVSSGMLQYQTTSRMESTTIKAEEICFGCSDAISSHIIGSITPSWKSESITISMKIAQVPSKLW